MDRRILYDITPALNRHSVQNITGGNLFEHFCMIATCYFAQAFDFVFDRKAGSRDSGVTILKSARPCASAQERVDFVRLCCGVATMKLTLDTITYK